MVLVGLLAVGMTAVPSSASAADLIGYWPLNEGAGQLAVDATGLGHNGRLGSSSGPDDNDPSWIAGRFGSGLRFVGDQDQHVQLRNPAGLRPSRITVDAWLRRLGTPGRWRYVVSSGAVGCDFASYGLYTGFNGGLAFYVADEDDYVLSPELAAEAVWDGNWHRAVGTYDGARVRLYLDGTQVGDGSPTNLSIAYRPDGRAYIGTYHGSCERPFTGDVDDVRIGNGVASPATVRNESLQDTTKPLPPQPPPVAGPPAIGAPPNAGCLTVRATPRTMVAGRRTTLRISVRRGKRPVSKRTVSVRGLGIKRTKRTAGAGRVKLRVKARKHGTVKVTVHGQPSRCTTRIAVAKRR